MPVAARFAGGGFPGGLYGKWIPTGTTLGSGGQAIVELVTDGQGKQFALKRLAPKKPQQAYERFKREVEAISKLDHPNIIKVVDSSEEPPFYVMEYIKGAISLRKAMETGKNPYLSNPLRAVEFFRQMASALLACQSIKVVHRDLSPGNILILPDKTIKVIDFGVCQLDGSESITLVDESVGTHNYMAPECESGSEADIDGRADLYSAGKLLWTAITGQKAFSRERPAFNEKSMYVMLPEERNAWHLQILFGRTIRHSPSNRFQPEFAVKGAETVRRLIQDRFLPLFSLQEKDCPICGLGKFIQFAPEVPDKQGVYLVKCNMCGYIFQIHWDTLKKTLEESKNFD